MRCDARLFHRTRAGINRRRRSEGRTELALTRTTTWPFLSSMRQMGCGSGRLGRPQMRAADSPDSLKFKNPMHLQLNAKQKGIGVRRDDEAQFTMSAAKWIAVLPY